MQRGYNKDKEKVILSRNRTNKVISWNVRYSYHFEPTFTLNGMLIIVLRMSGHPGNRCQWKTKAYTAAAHLAAARSQKIGNGISGLQKKKRSRCEFRNSSFFIWNIWAAHRRTEQPNPLKIEVGRELMQACPLYFGKFGLTA